VALADVPKEKIPSRQPDRLTLDNRGCRFTPHAAVVTVGSTITVTNSDPVFHTVHLYGPAETNLSLFKGDKIPWVARRPGLIQVRCDVHGWMRAFIRVDEHPLHAVSDATGVFRIENIPAGTYQLEVWHEKLGEQKKTVRIEPGKTERIEVEYSLNG
jgi:plastocyanin